MENARVNFLELYAGRHTVLKDADKEEIENIEIGLDKADAKKRLTEDRVKMVQAYQEAELGDEQNIT